MLLVSSLEVQFIMRIETSSDAFLLLTADNVLSFECFTSELIISRTERLWEIFLAKKVINFVSIVVEVEIVRPAVKQRIVHVRNIATGQMVADLVAHCT